MYRTSPDEAKELKAQLDQYSDDGYIDPAGIADAASTSFARKMTEACATVLIVWP